MATYRQEFSGGVIQTLQEFSDDKCQITIYQVSVLALDWQYAVRL